MSSGIWQVCPKCGGEKKVPLQPISGTDSPWRDCPTCDGAGVLSVVTGKPPKKDGNDNPIHPK